MPLNLAFPTSAVIAANSLSRRRIIAEATRQQSKLWTGKVNGSHFVPVRLYGLLTHITIEGDMSRIDYVEFCDFNNYVRFKCNPAVLPQRQGVTLLPVANVSFGAEDYEYHTLCGAMYMNVVNASAHLAMFGTADELLVTQHCFDNIPLTGQGFPMLPMLDMSTRTSTMQFVA